MSKTVYFQSSIFNQQSSILYMPTVSSVQNIITAYSQQLKFKERLASVKKIETQQTQKDSVTISKDARRLFEEAVALKHRPVESESQSDAEKTDDNNTDGETASPHHNEPENLR